MFEENDVVWRSKPAAATPTTHRRWLILANGSGIGAALAAKLTNQGDEALLVRGHLSPGEPQNSVTPDLAVALEDAEALASLVKSGSWLGIVHLCNVDLAGSALDTAVAISIENVLHLVQTLARTPLPTPPRLWLVTRGAQPADSSADISTVHSAPIWGLGKVIALEHPELHCVCVDLPPVGSADDAALLATELRTGDGENAVAYRRGKRVVPRLRRAPTKPLSKATASPLRLEIETNGLLDRLEWRPTSRRHPGLGEVEIEVRATGLNFRDVLIALGMYPGDAETLGVECAGIVVAVGESVEDLKVGDEVMAIAAGSFASFVTTDARMVERKPSRLSFEQAAALPIVFLTARYGLEDLASIEPGDRVLIHAAAGGVGLAAIQVAKLAGAEIFTTASLPKWAVLRASGIQHVMNSRTLDFGPEVMVRTEGHGVDIVLNSLIGPFIPQSMGVLAAGGHFIEIGKRQVLDAAQAKALREDVNYAAFDLAETVRREPNRIKAMLKSLRQGFEDGAFEPLPCRIFPATSAVTAFRTMAKAKHIGKLVVAQSGRTAGLRSDRTYLVTGGLGALGRQVASSLVAGGAQSLILIGRSEPSPATLEAIENMERRGTRVAIARADVADRDALGAALTEAGQLLPPIGGVIHAAGTIDDALLIDQTSERFERVLAPKIKGAWNLHLLTRDCPLEFFVMFSSMAALVGSPGQGNYAAANAFLDALAHHRAAQGLPALSIDWGPWSGAGMAETLADRGRRAAQWLDVIQPETALQILQQLLGSTATQIAVLSVDWPRFTSQFPGGPPSLFAELVPNLQPSMTEAAPGVAHFAVGLRAAPARRRRALVLAHVQAHVAEVLGLDTPETLDRHQTLMDLGLDSLMVVELRAKLQASTRHALPATIIFERLNIQAVADYLAVLRLPEE